MAKKDIINFSGNKSLGVNTTFSVGPGGGNGQADVMLVQALFRYIANFSMQVIKIKSGLRIPTYPVLTEFAAKKPIFLY